MLMVIFGAGASYDSYPSSLPSNKYFPDDRPPLAVELFDERQEFARVLGLFPDCQSLIPHLRHRDPNEAVERVLERLQAESVNDPIGQREMTAIRYYLQRIIWDCEERWNKRHNGVTNYRSLLRLIRIHNKESEPVCLVTFNYDTMLEKAIPALGGNIKEIKDYISSPRYKIFKVHGSVNWGRVLANIPFDLSAVSKEHVPMEIIRNVQFLLQEPSNILDEYEIMGDVNIHKVTAPDSNTEYALFPAIAIPVETKVDFQLPSPHLTMLKEHIPRITKLLVIGWRATDMPFLQLIVASARPDILVHIVCEDQSKGDEAALHMQNAGVKGEYFTQYQGFTDFVLNGKAEKFLSIRFAFP